MLLLIILLILSMGINIALIYGIIRMWADEDMNKMRKREGLKVE